MEYGLNELAKLIEEQKKSYNVNVGSLRRLKNEHAIYARKIDELNTQLLEQEKFITVLEKQYHYLEDKIIDKGLKSLGKEAEVNGRAKSSRSGSSWFGFNRAESTEQKKSSSGTEAEGRRAS